MGGVAIVVFSDLVDSTALLARLGDDRMEEVRRAHVEDVTRAVTDSGGRLIKTLGDGAMASFESALGALSAAARIQVSVERLDRARGQIGIEARVGVAAGEPIPAGEDLHGMSVVIASRLCAAAGSGEVLVHDLVAALVASRDGAVLEQSQSLQLKGVPVPVGAMKLRWRELVTNEQDLAHSAAREASSAQGRDGVSVLQAEDAPQRPQRLTLPRMLAAYGGEPLIGREEEIGLLGAATTPRPGSHAVLVLGEPGIGKTRHAAAAAAEAHAHGAAVVLARCPPEPAIAFEPWVRAIGELARSGGEGWRSSLAQAAGTELAGLVPELSDQVAPGERAGAAEVVVAEGARYRLLRGISAALAHAAGGASLHVVLDDAHWCDAASAQALGHLLESPPAEGIVVVVTARERELGRRHPVTKVLGELRRTGDLAELELEGLDDSGLAALVAARVGRSITPRLAAKLRARTAGNPFFAAELVRDLDERGALRSEEELEAAPAPDAVADLVEERLSRLGPVTERLLTAVAAIGPSAPVALAARAAGIDDQAAAVAVGQAVAERLVDEMPAAQQTIAFPHALIREALTAGADDATRARLHLATARALEEQPETEPAELARHYGLAVSVAGPELAIGAYRRAAEAAAEAHDHEQAALQLRRALTLIADSELATRAPLLLELGDQDLLAGDLSLARAAFLAAGDAARSTGDAATLARAALGFAGGYVAFGLETGADDVAVVGLLREGLEALGDEEPKLALRMIFRVCYALVYTDDDHAFDALLERAKELEQRLGDTESRVLAQFARIYAQAAHTDEPLTIAGTLAESFLALSDLADGCDRDDLRFRVLQLSAVAHYALGQIDECDRAVDRAAAIATRLGSPRFLWEVDFNRGMRKLDRGDREGAEALIHRAGEAVRRLRPDIQLIVEMAPLTSLAAIYDADTTISRTVFEAVETATPWASLVAAGLTWGTAVAGDNDTATRRLAELLSGDLARVRRPDIHLPAALCYLAAAASLAKDHEAAERLRPLLEPLRGYVAPVVPQIGFGQIVEWHIGLLELLAGRHDSAVGELETAVARADTLEFVYPAAAARVDLALALHRRDDPGDRVRAHDVLAEGESIARRYTMRWIEQLASTARAELEGQEQQASEPPHQATRPIRALSARAGRRALAVQIRSHDDVALERRFCDAKRQRALLRAMARGFQPARAGGFNGVIAYELETYAIEPPPEAPWRWAIEVDSLAGRAKLLELAPLNAAVTIHFGLSEWVRTLAGLQSPITAMAAGRGSIEGDLLVAARLQAMFGAI